MLEFTVTQNLKCTKIYMFIEHVKYSKTISFAHVCTFILNPK